MVRRPVALSVPLVLATAACAPGEEVDLIFAARVGDQDVDCRVGYDGVGLTDVPFKFLDARFYVSDVRLLAIDGAETPVELLDDDLWQGDGVALLDFEDASGGCGAGTPETNSLVSGRVPKGDYTGVSFVLGVPEAQNHLDLATAEAPLNLQGMFWTWTAGYRFLRVEVRPDAGEAWFAHLGSTGCEGTPAGGFSCTHANRARVELQGFDPNTDLVVLDLAALFAESDFTQVPDGETDGVRGCMSEIADPECAAVLASLGLDVSTGLPSGDPQTAFRVEAR